MEIDTDDELLQKIASGGAADPALFPSRDVWPKLLQTILTRLDNIAHNEFPIPKLPPPTQLQLQQDQRLLSPLPSSPIEPTSANSSQDANKENSDPLPPPLQQNAAASAAAPELPAGSLPPQIQDMLDEISSTLKNFPKHPPHTVQRLAELILNPHQHYRALAPYLHAVDRVVHVTSGSSTYPLPPAVPETTLVNGVAEANGAAAAVSWGNTASNLGTDEALGGALLTPIPWLGRQSPEEPSSGSQHGHAELRTESTETIEGPNGVGSIETVSISLNGIPSMGASGTTRGVTQGELLRQEQRLGVVPMNQLPKRPEEELSDPAEEDDEEVPHARGPEEIGAEDLGPQSVTTSHIGAGIDATGIDVEAAVGRKMEHNDDDDDDTGSKRGAEDVLDEDVLTKKPKADEDEPMEGAASGEAKGLEGKSETKES